MKTPLIEDVTVAHSSVYLGASLHITLKEETKGLMTQELDHIISDAWDLWDQAHRQYPDLVPQESAPILWFGDESRYQKSPVKIVTVGVNPGPLAFLDGNRWRLYRKLEDTTTRRDPTVYREAMNEFIFDDWFKPFNDLLAPFDAGYTVRGTHEALHLDLCPIMTTRLWSTLSRATRDELARGGALLLKRLLRYLDPQWVFLSVSRDNYKNYMHQQLALNTSKRVSCLQKHEVREVTQEGSQAKMFWFKKTGMRPISPAGASLRAFGESLNDPQAPDPLVDCGQAHQVARGRAARPRAASSRVAPPQATPDTAGMTPNTFQEEVRAVTEAEVSTFRYSHRAGRYQLYRLNLMSDEPVQLKRITGRRSFVNLIFELDSTRVGKAFLEVTPHFTDGWRAQASQELLRLEPLNSNQDAQYIRLINFNHLLGVRITSLAQIREWVLNIEEQLESMLSVDAHRPLGQWSYMNNKLNDQWHHFSQLLPIQQ